MSASLSSRLRHGASALILAATVTACASVEPSRVPLTAAPDVAPQRPLTSFSEAQACVDRQLVLASGRQVVSVGNFEDRTRTASVGGREMIEAAVRNTSRASGRFGVRRFNFVTDTVGPTSQLAGTLSVSQQQLPDFVISGAITQLDQGIETATNGGSLIFGDSFGIGAQQNDQAGVLGIDLQAFNAQTGDLLAQSSNTIVVLNKQQAANARGAVETFGVTAEVSLERADGIGSASRALIDLGVIELLGELTGVPYWECLSIPSTNPQVRQLVERWWRSLGPGGQSAYVQARLTNLGYLAPGAGPGALPAALARYETAVGLTPDGRPDAQVYAALLHQKPTDRVAAASAGDLMPTPPAPAAPAPEAPQATTPAMVFRAEALPDNAFQFRIGVSRRGFVNCYLQLQSGEVVQIYPNAYQPAGFLRRGTFTVPPSPQAFSIRMDDRPGDMLAACVHTGRDINPSLPAAMRQPPFTPMPGQSLQSVLGTVRQLGAGAQISQARLTAPQS